MLKVFKDKNYRKGGEYSKYRGYLQVGPSSKDRKKIVLYTDKIASERELRKRQAEADAELQDGAAVRRRKHGVRPIADHVTDYLTDLCRTSKSDDHHRISEFMLNRLVKLANWKRLSDITRESLEAVVEKVAADGKTVEYQNAFIKRAKAFCNWCVPDRLMVNPVIKVKRGSTLRAKKNRARRAATIEEIRALFRVAPSELQFKWAVLLLSGLRRREAAELAWSDLRINAPIPFIQLRDRWTKNGQIDVMPLHPVLLMMLTERMACMPGASVLNSVPDNKTLYKYQRKASVEKVIDERRFDTHAFRHTFKTWLDEAGCSESTKKALMRHSVSDVSGKYSHSRLAELYAALSKLPSPVRSIQAEAAVKPGTDDQEVSRANAGQSPCVPVQLVASSCTMPMSDALASNVKYSPESQAACTALHDSALRNLIASESADIVPKTRPSTQVD